MKFRAVAIAALCGSLFLPVLRLNAAAQSQDPTEKPPVVNSGYITKIDLKKKVLTVQGFIKSVPADIPGEKPGTTRPGVLPSGELENSISAAGRRGQNGKNETSIAIDGAKPERTREFKVYVGDKTIIQQGATAIEFKELAVKDYVMVVGTAKGKTDVVAASIAVSTR